MGKFNQPETEQIESKPPDLIEVLANICARSKYKPKMFPADPKAAASYWINHQEPPNEFTEAVQYVEQGDRSYWKTPYHDRLAGNLKIFLSMKSIHQVFIIEHIERGVPWRGDGIEMFQSVIRETERMKADPEKYIEEALQAMKNFKMARV